MNKFESLKKRKRDHFDQPFLTLASQDTEDPEGKEFLESANKKRRRDDFDQPVLTGVPKFSLTEVGKLIQDCLNQDNFNNIAKPLDPQIGDIYIYRCGAIQPVHALDNANWRYTHSGTRQNESHFPGRKFLQCTYARRSGDKSQKKVILFDNVQAVVVVHYR